MEEAALCFEISSVKIFWDNINIEMEVTIIYPYEIVESICEVEVIHDLLSAKDDRFLANKISEDTISVHEFEVKAIGFGLEEPSMEEIFTALLLYVEPQHRGTLHPP